MRDTKEALIKSKIVMPAKAGIQEFQRVSGFPLSRERLVQSFPNCLFTFPLEWEGLDEGDIFRWLRHKILPHPNPLPEGAGIPNDNCEILT